MKNLAKTIDKILKIEPDLKGQLLPIRRKYNRSPQKAMSCWRELLSILNSNVLLTDPQKEQIRKVLVTTPKRKRLFYTFKQVGPDDKIIGAVPEPIADKLKAHDRRRIDLAKKNVEADVTHNLEMYSEVMRKQALLDIEQARIWVAVKDHFKLWAFQEGNLQIKKNGEILVVTTRSRDGGGGGGGSTFLMHTPMGTMKMDGNALAQWFKTMGMKPPPGLMPPDTEKEDDEDD